MNGNRKVYGLISHIAKVQRKILAVFKAYQKGFPKEHKLSKIFHSNIVKLYCICTTNTKNLIIHYNSKILNETPTQQQKPCNCARKENCPIKDNCEAQNIEHYETLEEELRFNYQSFRNQNNINKTELSKYM